MRQKQKEKQRSSNMINLTNKRELIHFLKQNKLWAKKSFSQNFLVDKDSLDKIVEAAVLDSDNTTHLPSPQRVEENKEIQKNIPEKEEGLVLEIGPGLGVLTQELVKKTNTVIAVELDKDLANLLHEQFPSNIIFRDDRDCFTSLAMTKGLHIINDDILKINLDEVIGKSNYKIVANIPYAITSRILQLFLSRKHQPELMVLLVQKEVAERVCAEPGDMSILSVSVQLYGEPEIVDIVPAESFFPAPKVDSAILKIRIKNNELRDLEGSEKSFFRCVHIGFASRRKTLLNNLAAGYHLPKEKVSDILKSIGFSENIRAQELSVDDWKTLTKHFES